MSKAAREHGHMRVGHGRMNAAQPDKQRQDGPKRANGCLNRKCQETAKVFAQGSQVQPMHCSCRHVDMCRRLSTPRSGTGGTAREVLSSAS